METTRPEQSATDRLRLLGDCIRTAVCLGLFFHVLLTQASAVLPIEGKDNSPTPLGKSKPAKNVPYIDPVYRTTITRVTDASVDAVNPSATNIYSRHQSFNADGTKLLLFTSRGGVWSLYNAAPPYNKIKTLSAPRLGGGAAEPQWDPANPDVFCYLNENGTDKKLYSHNVATGASSTVADFNDRLPWTGIVAISTKAEGSPSEDGRYWAFCADTIVNKKWQRLGYFTWDKQTDTILGTLTATEANGLALANHVSMSPSGKNVVISVHDNGPGAVQYNRTLTTKIRQLGTRGEHSDIAKLSNGHDAYVSVDNQKGDVYFVDMETGERTVLYNLFSHGAAVNGIHFSGKAYGKPGWAIISTYYAAGALRWDQQKVFAIELTPNPRIYILAHHHGATMPAAQYYWTSPRATTNRDLTKVVFTSNWQVVTETALDTYMINVSPADIPPSGTNAGHQPTSQKHGME